MVRRVSEITVTLDCIFRLALCSRRNVSFNIICLNVLEGIKQLYLLMRFKKHRLETPFKVDHVKALIIASHCENMVLYFSKEVKQLAAFSVIFLGFQWPNIRSKMVLASPMIRNTHVIC